MPTEDGGADLDAFDDSAAEVATPSDDLFPFFVRETGRAARRPFAAITGLLRFADLL